VAEARVEVAQVVRRRLGCQARVLALIDGRALRQPIDGAGGGHELPEADGPGRRARARVEAALDHRHPDEVLGQAALAQLGLDHVLVAPAALDPSLEHAAALVGAREEAHVLEGALGDGAAQIRELQPRERGVGGRVQVVDLGQVALAPRLVARRARVQRARQITRCAVAALTCHLVAQPGQQVTLRPAHVGGGDARRRRQDHRGGSHAPVALRGRAVHRRLHGGDRPVGRGHSDAVSESQGRDQRRDLRDEGHVVPTRSYNVGIPAK
jgi:hypothetical protein